MSLKQKVQNFLIALVVAVLAVGFTASMVVTPAFAGEECWADFDLEDCETEDGTLVIDITQDVVNDIDSAVGGGYWATDSYTRHIRVWDFGEDPLAIVQYDGTFVTVEGPSPNDTGEVGAGVTGTMTGGYVAWFDAEYLEDPAWPTEGYVGSFDYEGDPETGEVYPVSWLAQFFEEWSGWFYEWWGWLYMPPCETSGYWVNSSDGSEGDITGEPDFRCLPPPSAGPMPDPVIPMYVYYSGTGFFGIEPNVTNTITLYSALGPPAPESVAKWAGVATPDDLPEDYKLACSAILWDNGSDRGTFACDGFLTFVGERRANLRNDIQGSDFDLDPKIGSYYDQLAELGLLP